MNPNSLYLLPRSITVIAPPEHNRLIGCPVLSVCCAVADLQSIAAAVVTSSATVLRYGDNELWVIKIRDSTFLWHQVHCMVAVLFMIGKGLESLNVVDMLLDTTSIPRKPQYTFGGSIGSSVV
ncbi:uncharacterized protein [Arachis hypogaea]|uniref:uncharacterized protein n=1 Tax=Arachis hypogaea TaxID=3818 RepID=UPI003B20F32D|nr:tRNA pseudouridine(38/39) synthase [Arachis hypogaea]